VGDGPGDRIELRGLRLSAFCGVLPEEKVRRQPFEVDMDVHADLSAAATSDDLGDTVDYGSLTTAVAAVAADERFDLMERLAGRIAEVILAVDGVDAVTVVVRKLRPPVPDDLATSAVRIHRTA